MANTVADPNDQASQDREMQKLRDLEKQVSFQKLTNPNYAVKRLLMLPSEEKEQKVKRPLDMSQAFLGLLLPKKNRDGLLGDLTEEYQELLESDGKRTALIWFYKQILTSLWPTLQNLVRVLMKCGFIVMMEEAIRRITR